MSEFIKTYPTDVYLATFSGGSQLCQEDVTNCIEGLSNEYVTIDEPEGKVEVIHDPISVEGGLVYTQDGIKKTLRECFWECLGGPIGSVAAVGGTVGAAGSIPKRLIGRPSIGDASKFTSIPSIIAHRNPKLGNIPIPKWMPKVRPTLTGLQPAGTKSLLRFVGRWFPGIGWGLLAADLVILDQCVANCRDEPSFLMQLLQETILPKPAY